MFEIYLRQDGMVAADKVTRDQLLDPRHMEIVIKSMEKAFTRLKEETDARSS